MVDNTHKSRVLVLTSFWADLALTPLTAGAAGAHTIPHQMSSTILIIFKHPQYTHFRHYTVDTPQRRPLLSRPLMAGKGGVSQGRGQRPGSRAGVAAIMR